MHKVFIDTDVILDLFIDRPPFHGDSLRLFSFIKRNSVPGFTSPVVVANTYYLLTRMRDKKYATKKIRQLRKLIGIAALTQEMVDQAIQSPHKDFEDSLQYNCATGNGIQFIITRNIGDYPKANAKVVQPMEFVQMSIRSQAETN